MRNLTLGLFAAFAGLALVAGTSPQAQQPAAPPDKAAVDKAVRDLEALRDAAKAKLAQAHVKDVPPKFPRGAKRTPLPKIIEALRTGRAVPHAVMQATPAQVAMVPKRLSMWGNSQYGDCVSAESAFAIAAFSVYSGIPEIFIPEQTVIAWAGSHGFLNGANLLDVIQAMEKDGMKDESGTVRKEGTPSTVDYSNEATLQNAISIGPVSIAIDANALPSGAGNASGWFSFGGGNYQNTDHCVGLCGYGPTKFLADSLGVPVPSGAPATCYLLFTWDTIGMVSHEWLMGTCQEAWLRQPTVLGVPPIPPVPVPPAPVPPVPPGPYPQIVITTPGVYWLVPAADAMKAKADADTLDALRKLLAPKAPPQSQAEPPLAAPIVAAPVAAPMVSYAEQYGGQWILGRK